MNVWNLFQSGGPVLFILIIVSVYTLGLILKKLYEFRQFKLSDYSFSRKAEELLKSGQPDEALRLLKESVHPGASVLRAAIHAGSHSSVSPEMAAAEVKQEGSRILRSLQTGQRALSAVSHLSPLLGLLGTVTGMIQSFSEIQKNGADPSVLAGGIWEALLTTAAGLMIAIPAMAVLHYLEGVTDEFRIIMQEKSENILLFYKKSYYVKSISDPAASGSED